MEMPELDGKIKRALLSKADEILPSEDAFHQILAGIEKKQTHGTFFNCKYYMMAFLCALSVILGTTFFLSVCMKSSPLELVTTFKTLVPMDESNNVIEKNADQVSKQAPISSHTQLEKSDVNVLLVQTLTGCFLLNNLNDLGLYLRFLILGRITLVQTWYDHKFWHRLVPAY